MTNAAFRIVLLAVAAVFIGGCTGRHQTDAYIGHSVAEYAADHGDPAMKFALSSQESVFRWDTIEPTLGQAIGNGLIAGPPRPSLPALCSVRLTATTQSANPELKDWTIRSADRQGPC